MRFSFIRMMIVGKARGAAERAICASSRHLAPSFRLIETRPFQSASISSGGRMRGLSFNEISRNRSLYDVNAVRKPCALIGRPLSLHWIGTQADARNTRP